jgi:hypothetical protein
MNNKFLPGVVLFIIAFIAGNNSAQAVTGSGTAGRIPVWTGPTTQGNSVITQSAGKIGIGTAAPGGVLGVTSTTGTPAINGSATTNGIGVYGVSNNSIGILGISSTSIGVGGYSPNNYGVLGVTAEGIGVYGSASGSGDAFYGSANTGSGGYFFSSQGTGVYATAVGSNGYAGYFYSGAYRGGYVKSGNSNLYSLYVDTQDGPSQATAALNVVGTIRGEGNLVIAGSKAGYVVDEMQNADSLNLEAGDVVVIADDSSAPVLGNIPVPRVKRAASPNDTSVVGVVDQVMYVPDQAIRDAYEAQRKADHDAASRAEKDGGTKDRPMADIQNRISDATGTLHVDDNSVSVGPGRYCSVVTLGAYKAVKADASFGTIHAGDLLTTSSHAGYAMRVNDKAAASDAIIGKALSSLASGTGSVTVMVTLK